MKEKKPKIKKMKEPRKKISASNVLFMGLFLFLTVALFIGLVIAQSYMLEEITYKQVLVARKNIPENTIITDSNIDDFFTVKQLNILDITDGAMNSAEELVGKKSRVPLYTGEIITLKDFENLLSYIESLEEPVEISVKIDNIADADGGKLRTGDIVNLAMMFTKTQLGLTEQSVSNTESSILKKENEISYNYENLAQYVMENLYVSKVLDDSGTEIEPTDTKSSATIIFFIINKKDEASLNNALANCSSLRISRVVNHPFESRGFGYKEDESVKNEEEIQE